MKKNFYLSLVFIFLVVAFFFKPFLLDSKLPIPSDTIIGLYYPFRDLYAKEYPNGIPFKNFLITDPVRQQYPWKFLSMGLLKKGELPLWNPYSMAGYPLLANHQSAPFYPLNLLFLIFPFQFSWSFLILLQPLLAGLFMYAYLVNLRISKIASALGALVFAFSGFSIAWMEWGTIGHVMMWVPLILLSLDKIFISYAFIQSSKLKTQNSKLQFKIKNYMWPFVFIFSLSSSFFAGHLQTFLYIFLLSVAYLIARTIQHGKNKGVLLQFTIYYLLFTIITAIQWIPTLQLIQESARGVDQIDWTKEGWFIPWQHLIQFVAPDFFGNPTTLNYFSTWNYAEFVGYIGILPLVFALYALFFRRDKKTLFFGSVFFVGLIFALPTFFAKIPYVFNFPFISTSQPTRLLSMIDFSLAALSALGVDYFIRQKKSILYPLGFLAIVFVSLWAFVFFGKGIGLTSAENLLVAKRNLYLPTLLFITSIVLVLVLASTYFSKSKKFTTMIYIIIVGITAFDLLRFGLKFTPFTNKEYLFPSTKVISFLQKNIGNYRFMTVDSRILPPNFSTVYKIQSIDGYDPLYLRRYGELIAASERGEPNINPPFGFNRIITPHNFDSKIIDLLGVKYVLSLSDLSSPKLEKVFQEGQTRVYENKNVLPRAFFVEQVRWTDNRDQVIQVFFKKDFDPKRIAILEGWDKRGGRVPDRSFYVSVGKAEIVSYSENKVIIKTKNKGEGFLVLTDSFYPNWRAQILADKDFNYTGDTKVYRTDYNFRGIYVPDGERTIEFSNSLFFDSNVFWSL